MSDPSQPVQPVVLVVEDEPDLADTYALWLEASYTVKTAYDGRSALDTLGDAVDVVVLDRRMPGLSGDEVLSAIRDRGLDCRVVMATAVKPDVDIVDMAFDAYLVKPIDKDELDDLVERLLARSQYDNRIQEYYALATKKAILDAEMSEQDRAASDESAQLETQLADLREQTDEALDRVFTRDDFPDVVHSIVDPRAAEADSTDR